MKKEWIDSSWINAAPLIIFLIFFGFFSLTKLILNIYAVDVPCIEDSGHIVIITKRFSGQFVFVFFIGINAFLGVIGLVIYFLLIHKYWSNFEYTLLCLFFCVFFAFLLWAAYIPVVEPVVDKIIGNANAAFILRHVKVLDAIKFGDFIGNLILTAAVLTIYAILSGKYTVSQPIGENSKGDLEHQLKNLLNRVEDLRLVLYIAMLLLVVVILRASAVLNWALRMLPENIKEMSEFFATFTLTMGVTFTILLASMYIPAYYILRKRAEAFVGKSDYTKDKLAADFKIEFFGFSIKDSLPPILAIIAPFLTGVITDTTIT
ncbi:MAG TPA: hypothetical protein VF604_17885 [Pyrinomonadaceae bacterium]|jgi:hypothetical protein